MTAPNATFNLSATVSAASGPIAVGDAVVPIGGVYYVATAANRATAGQRAHGIATSAWGSSSAGAVSVQHVGVIDTLITSLGAGAASWVRVSTAGLIERCTPSGTDDVVGYCAADGTLFAMFGLFTPSITNGSSSGATLASPNISGTVTFTGTKLRVLSIPGYVQTTAATTGTLASFTMLDDTSCRFDFTASMKGVGAVAKAGAWSGSATYQRAGGAGPVITNGTPDYGSEQETTAGDGVTFVIVGNDVTLVVTSADADDRNWTCEFRVAETLNT